MSMLILLTILARIVISASTQSGQSSPPQNRNLCNEKTQQLRTCAPPAVKVCNTARSAISNAGDVTLLYTHWIHQRHWIQESRNISNFTSYILMIKLPIIEMSQRKKSYLPFLLSRVTSSKTASEIEKYAQNYIIMWDTEIGRASCRERV